MPGAFNAGLLLSCPSRRYQIYYQDVREGGQEYFFFDPVDGSDLNSKYAGQQMTQSISKHLHKRLVASTRRSFGLTSNSTYAVNKLRQEYAINGPAAGREYRREWMAKRRATREYDVLCWAACSVIGTDLVSNPCPLCS